MAAAPAAAPALTATRPTQGAGLVFSLLLGDCLETEEENQLPAVPEGTVAPVLAVPVDVVRPVAAPLPQAPVVEPVRDPLAGNPVPAAVSPECAPLEEPAETPAMAEVPAFEVAEIPSLEEAPRAAAPAPLPEPPEGPVPAVPVTTVQEAETVLASTVGQPPPESERAPTSRFAPKSASAATESIVEPAAGFGAESPEQGRPVMDTIQPPQPEQQASAPTADVPEHSEPAREALSLETPSEDSDAPQAAVAEASTRFPEAAPEIRTAAPVSGEHEEPDTASEPVRQPAPEGTVAAPAAAPAPPAEISEAVPAAPDRPVLRHSPVVAAVPGVSPVPAEAAIGARLEDYSQGPADTPANEAKPLKTQTPAAHVEVPPEEPDAGSSEAPVKSTAMAVDAVHTETYGGPVPPEAGSSPAAAASPRSGLPEVTVAPEQSTPAAASREPVREIAVRLSGENENVEIRMAEQSGEIRLSVHAADAELRQALQDNLPELVQGLEERGFAAEAWRAGEGSLRSDTGEHGGGEQPQGGGQGGAHQDGRRHRRNPQPEWLDEIARSLESDRERSTDDEYRY